MASRKSPAQNPTRRRRLSMPVSAVTTRLAEFSALQRVQAGSLLLTVFGDLLLPRGSRVWIGSLIQLLSSLGVNERMIRTAVFRLAQENWLSAHASGRRSDYQLTDLGAQRIGEASRRIYAGQSTTWDQRWRFVFIVKEIDSAQREQLRKALFWQGFGSLGPNCFVHPTTDLDSIFATLSAEGLGAISSSLLPMRAADAGIAQSASGHNLVVQAWDLEQLAERYRGFVASYEPILHEVQRARPSELDPEKALLIRLLLIHDYRRLLLRDPNLPAELLPTHWPGEAARALCKTLYRLLLAPSEAFVTQTFLTADQKRLPPAGAVLTRRFQGPDPLLDEPRRERATKPAPGQKSRQ
jgi:phenylacetic acid degradation operon negative regulatory protein